MATIPLPPDFSAFLRLLHAHDVRYLLIGGHAVGYHGYVRATADMDIWVPQERGNAERVVVESTEVPIHVISLDKLKENKRASGRLKDLVDLEHLP